MKKIFRKNWLIFLVLVLAAFLRLYKISGYMEFLGDQGRDVLVVYRFLKKGDLMFIGPQTSVGNMYLGPWYYYLMAPALLLAGFNPVGPAVMVVLLGVATVWLIWKVGREWFGGKVGLLAALLTAVSPVVIYYSVFSWNPNIMPFFALLSMWLIWRIWRREEYQKMPLLAISLAIVLNSHYLGLLLFPVAGIFWLLILKKTQSVASKKSFILYTLCFILLFFFLMSPLVLFDIKHNLANFNAFRQFFAVRQTTVNLKFYKGLLKLPEIFNQLYAQLLVRQDFWRPAYVFFPLVLFGLWRERKNKAVALVGVWSLVGLLGLTNYKQHVYAHYFGFLWPAAILLLAIFLFQLKSVFWVPIVVLFLCLALSNWHGWQEPNYQLKRARLVAEAICQKVERENLNRYNIVNLASYNDFRALAYRYFLLKDCSNRPMRDDQYPEAEVLFVVWEDPARYPDPVGTDIWEIQSAGRWKIEEQFSAFDTKILKLIRPL